MIKAAREVAARNSSGYFVIFGEGFLRPELEGQIAAAGLAGRFLLPGFRTDLQKVMHDIDISCFPPSPKVRNVKFLDVFFAFPF